MPSSTGADSGRAGAAGAGAATGVLEQATRSAARPAASVP